MNVKPLRKRLDVEWNVQTGVDDIRRWLEDYYYNWMMVAPRRKSVSKAWICRLYYLDGNENTCRVAPLVGRSEHLRMREILEKNRKYRQN